MSEWMNFARMDEWQTQSRPRSKERETMNNEADERRRALEEWLAARPECVRRLAEEFPLGSRFAVKGRTMHLVGYTESDRLIVSTTDPAVDYDGATASQEYLCAAHVRSGEAEAVKAS